MRYQGDRASELEQSVAQAVRMLRERQGFSQTELAEAMSDMGFRFHQATIYKIESGERRVTAAEAWGLAGIFDVDVNELFAGDTAAARQQSIRAIADRMGQAILAFDEVALRIRVIQSAIESVFQTQPDTPYQTGPDTFVSASEYLRPFRAFTLHNEMLWRLRTEVWSDPEFQALMADVAGIAGLAPVNRSTDRYYAGYDSKLQQPDPIDVRLSIKEESDEVGRGDDK